MSQEEVWKVIPEYPDYEVSTHGKIKSYQGRKPRIMKIFESLKGYKRVRLWNDGKSKIFSVHVLVLQSFVGSRPKDFDGCHNDGVKENNHIDNLRWASRKDNCADRIKHGTCLYGEKNHSSKLNNQESLYIRYCKNMKQKELSKMFNVSIATIGNIRNGRNWKHLMESE